MALTGLTRVKTSVIGNANAFTIAELLSAVATINTINKFIGKLTRVTDNNKLASASGKLPTDSWHYADGTVVQ